MARGIYRVSKLDVRTQQGMILRDISIDLRFGKTTGLFGESGSGKSTLARAMANQLKPGTSLARGKMWLPKRVALVQQNPFLSFNPVIPVGDQIGEYYTRELNLKKQEAKSKSIKLMSSLGISDSENRWNDFPLQFSGGELQRLAVAKALACNPSLLILDEATSALDEKSQTQVLDVILRFQRRTGCAILLISHSLELIRERCSDGIFLDESRIVESGPIRKLLSRPDSSKLRKLIDARKTFQKIQFLKTTDKPILEIAGLKVMNPDQPKSTLVSLDSFSLGKKESLGIVAPSGSGKSSLIKGILGCYPSRMDSVSVRTKKGTYSDLGASTKKSFGYVLQDPRDSFDPRLSISQSLEFSSRGAFNSEVFAEKISQVAKDVGLDIELLDRLPKQLSGGQLQRASIARALLNKPEILFLDEPTSALDQENEVRVLKLLQKLRKSYGFSIVAISHSRFVTRALTDRTITL